MLKVAMELLHPQCQSSGNVESRMVMVINLELVVTVVPVLKLVWCHVHVVQLGVLLDFWSFGSCNISPIAGPVHTSAKLC